MMGIVCHGLQMLSCTHTYTHVIPFVLDAHVPMPSHSTGALHASHTLILTHTSIRPRTVRPGLRHCQDPRP